MAGESSSRRVLWVSAIVFTVMIGAALAVPWLFIDPYDDRLGDPRIYYVITVSEVDDSDPETAEAIDNLKNTSIPRSADELSPAGAELIDVVLANGTAYAYPSGAAEMNATRHEIRFCDDAMPVCDEFGPPPGDFGHRTIVDADDEQYVVIELRPSPPRNSFLVLQMSDARGMILFVFFPVLGLLAHQALFARKRQPRIVVGVAAYGTLLTIGGIADPFLYMFYDISLRQYSSALVGFTWLLIVGVAVAHRRNRSAKQHQTEVSDQ